MTETVLNKLEEAFAIGASDKEACFYADISHQALYTYQEKHPEFIDRKEALKERPVLLARQTVVKSIATNPELAFKYLERRAKHEFASRQEITGKDGEDQKIIVETRKHRANTDKIGHSADDDD